MQLVWLQWQGIPGSEGVGLDKRGRTVDFGQSPYSVPSDTKFWGNISLRVIFWNLEAILCLQDLPERWTFQGNTHVWCSQEDVNGEKLTVKKWWILVPIFSRFGADFFTVYADFSRFVRDINGEKKASRYRWAFSRLVFQGLPPLEVRWVSSAVIQTLLFGSTVCGIACCPCMVLRASLVGIWRAQKGVARYCTRFANYSTKNI